MVSKETDSNLLLNFWFMYENINIPYPIASKTAPCRDSVEIDRNAITSEKEAGTKVLILELLTLLIIVFRYSLPQCTENRAKADDEKLGLPKKPITRL